MTRIGLVLGGGGLVGIAWEIGVMAGLHEAGGFDPLAMEVIVGTSAGSAAGAQVAVGKKLPDLAQSQLRTAGRAPSAARAPARPFTIRPELLELFGSSEGTIEERARAMGRLAIEATPSLREEEFVGQFRTTLGTDEWPTDVDMRMTTAACGSGESVLWSRESGIPLSRAVASSCAIPGFFPTIEWNGERYMDGPRKGFEAELIAEKGLDALVTICPMDGMPGSMSGTGVLDDLQASGIPMVRVGGRDSLGAEVVNLMDPTQRATACEAGLASGRAAAPAFVTLA